MRCYSVPDASDLPITEWHGGSPVAVIDEPTGTTTMTLPCDGCGKRQEVSEAEFARYDATLCMACAAKCF